MLVWLEVLAVDSDNSVFGDIPLKKYSKAWFASERNGSVGGNCAQDVKKVSNGMGDRFHGVLQTQAFLLLSR